MSEELTLRSAHAALRRALPGHDVRVTCTLAGEGEPTARWSGSAFHGPCPTRIGYDAMVAHCCDLARLTQVVEQLVRQAQQSTCLCCDCAAQRESAAKRAAEEVRDA